MLKIRTFAAPWEIMAFLLGSLRQLTLVSPLLKPFLSLGRFEAYKA
jgi:hypothetical protein